jgi:two-component system response regulator HydG
MSRPSKLSSKVFLELPPVLAHYVESERNAWLDSNPNKGKLLLLNRLGVFTDLETLAVERRQQCQILGYERARALAFRTGFEQGRREGARHFELFGQNARLALQSGPVFAQLQGRFVTEQVTFEFDLDAGTLFRELVLHSCMEAIMHRMAIAESSGCVCWSVAGYLSGHVSEIIGRRVITVETECAAQGHKACRMVSRLDVEWDSDAEPWREALRMHTLDSEIAQRDELVANAQAAARKAQRSLLEISRRSRPSDAAGDVTLIADSSAMESVLRRARVLLSTDVPVLLVGEPGTGRDTLARYLHQHGTRHDGPFVEFDPRGLTPRLQQQELLGFSKGAFPGAFNEHKGALTRAHRGTLFIRDLASMDFETQGALLRAIQESNFTPLGSEKPTRTDVRIVSAVDQEPTELVKQGVVREALSYAIATTRIDLPPLRARDSDIVRIAEHFLRRFAERYEKEPLTISEEVKQVFLECSWPGNIRQLRGVMEHAAAMCQDPVLSLASLPEDILLDDKVLDTSSISPEIIQMALKRSRGNRSEAARRLGIGRTTLWRHMRRLGLE